MTIITDIRVAIALFRLIRKYRRTGKGGTVKVDVGPAAHSDAE